MNSHKRHGKGGASGPHLTRRQNTVLVVVLVVVVVGYAPLALWAADVGGWPRFGVALATVAGLGWYLLWLDRQDDHS